MPLPTNTARVLEPAPGVLAFFDGRVIGQRSFSPEPNWIDDGAYALGIAAFAIIDGKDALVYDTHMTIAHAKWMRETVIAAGARDIRVVLSHHHLDHIAGNAVFADCEIIAHALTEKAMREKRAALEAGAYDGPPPIKPVVMPTATFEGTLPVKVGRRHVELLHMDIHSHDGVVLWLPDTDLLLAGDTLEDNCTYVAEPSRMETHIAELDRITALGAARILPNHGDRDRIAEGGYGPSLIAANERYMRHLIEARTTPAERDTSLREFIGPELAAGTLTYFAPYEAVHTRNLSTMRAG